MVETNNVSSPYTPPARVNRTWPVNLATRLLGDAITLFAAVELFEVSKTATMDRAAVPATRVLVFVPVTGSMGMLPRDVPIRINVVAGGRLCGDAACDSRPWHGTTCRIAAPTTRA